MTSDWEFSDPDGEKEQRPEVESDGEWDEAEATQKPQQLPETTETVKTKTKESTDEAYVVLDDPVAEKERQLRLQKDQDLLGTDDLFSGFTVDEKKTGEPKAAGTPKEGDAKPKEATKKEPDVVIEDEFDSLHLDTSEKMAFLFEALREKLDAVSGKGYMKGCQNRLLTAVFKLLQDRLTLKDTKELHKKLAEAIRLKKYDAAQKVKHKVGGDPNKNTKFDVQQEWDDVYAEDWDEDEGYWDEEAY